MNSGWSRVRQLVATLAVCGGGVYAALDGALTWPLVVVLIAGLWAYSAKSVLQEAVKVAGDHFKGKLP